MTQFAIFLDSLVDDTFQLAGQVRVVADRRGGRLVQYRIKSGGGRSAAERESSGCHFVQYDAEGKQVGTGVKILRQRLLR